MRLEQNAITATGPTKAKAENKLSAARQRIAAQMDAEFSPVMEYRTPDGGYALIQEYAPRKHGTSLHRNPENYP